MGQCNNRSRYVSLFAFDKFNKVVDIFICIIIGVSGDKLTFWHLNLLQSQWFSLCYL